jgi:hypothetical protein
MEDCRQRPALAKSEMTKQSNVAGLVVWLLVSVGTAARPADQDLGGVAIDGPMLLAESP